MRSVSCSALFLLVPYTIGLSSVLVISLVMAYPIPRDAPVIKTVFLPPEKSRENVLSTEPLIPSMTSEPSPPNVLAILLENITISF